jgi:AAA domain-containing protein/Toprim domain-containing protein
MSTANKPAILSRFGRLKPSGDGWTALCPAHEDKNPSLSINVRSGRILVHCHAGCSQEEVLAALGIEARELFLDAIDGKRQIIATYDYVDEEGKLLYQVVRFEPKDFRQRRPDGVGGWIWNMNGAPRALYRLPEVLASDSVIICEGEKDCETAFTLGITAACNSGGAGKWKDEYSESFRAKTVTIIADADEPGRKHAQQVALSLAGKVRSLKVLEFPNAKDLSEWIDRGGTCPELLDLIRNTPDWKPPIQQRGFSLTSLRDLMLEPEERISWLLADKLPAGGLSVLSAKPKVGKSTFARCLSLAVSRGEPFLECETTKGPVIYLALEEKRSEVRRHFTDLGATGDEEIYVHAAAAPQEAVSELCQRTKQIRPVLIVIDPLFKFVRIRDEKAYAEVCNAIEPLLTLARESGAHVLLSHHNGKMEKADATDSILGSTAIFGGVDSAIILKKSDRYRTVQSSQRYGTDWAEVVLNFDPAERSLSLGVERSEAEAERMGEAIVTYLSGCGGPQTRVQIESHVEGKTKHKRTALKALCAVGRLSESGAGAKGDPLRYQLAQNANIAAEPESKQFVDPCSQVYGGTREQESIDDGEGPTKIDQILVPTPLSDSVITSKSREREMRFEEGEL